MPDSGMLIDYWMCTGCHTCEIACKQEHNLPVGKWGIKVTELGPMELGGGKYFYAFIPTPTDLCSLCARRVKEGKLPSCVFHCPAGVIQYGKLEELVKCMRDKSHMVLWAPRP